MKCQLVGKLKTTVIDPRITDLSFEQAELSLTLIREEEKRSFSKYIDLLGLSWTKEEVIRLTSAKKEGMEHVYPDKVIYPLSVMIKPDLIECLKASFGLETQNNGSTPNSPKNATSLSTVSKEEFISKMGNGHQFSLEK